MKCMKINERPSFDALTYRRQVPDELNYFEIIELEKVHNKLENMLTSKREREKEANIEAILLNSVVIRNMARAFRHNVRFKIVF